MLTIRLSKFRTWASGGLVYKYCDELTVSIKDVAFLDKLLKEASASSGYLVKHFSVANCCTLFDFNQAGLE